MNKNKFVLTSATLLILSFSLTGCTDASTKPTSNNKMLNDSTHQSEKVTNTPTSIPSAVPSLPESTPTTATEQSTPPSENVASEPQPATPPTPPTSKPGDPTSCPPGSTLVNDIPQLPPRCSIPVPSDFVEEGRPPG